MQILNGKNLKVLIFNATKKLAEEGIDSPALNSDYLAAYALGITKDRLPLHWNDEMSGEFVNQFSTLVNRRLAREPLQYILGEWSFLDINVKVGAGVLIPRPETEEMAVQVEYYLNENFSNKAFLFADVGSGTGILGITIARMFPKSSGICIDVSKDAIETLQKNINQNLSNDRRLITINGDLLSSVKKSSLDFIISNPPYIANNDIEMLQPEVKNFEPKIALAGGKIGIEVIFDLITQSSVVLKKNGLLAIEHGHGQRKNIIDFSEKHGFKVIHIGTDMGNKERYLIWEKI